MDIAFWITTVLHAAALIVFILILQVLSDLCYVITELLSELMTANQHAMRVQKERVRGENH